MKSILFYAFLFLILEYGLGYGLSRKILPKSLSKYSLMMGPWILNTGLILMLVVVSLLKIPTQTVSFIAALGLLILSIGERKTIRLGLKELLILGMVGVSVLINIAPLLLRDRFLTSISLGNNDIITYAINADFLVNHSIAESFKQPVTLTIANLLHDGFRWGPPLLQSFFLSLTMLSSWQITYLMQVIFFATMLPLLYVLYEKWYGRNELSWWVVVMGAFNANLLYMLYHNFYGQVVYWGILLLITILSSEYYRRSSNRLEWIVGAAIAAMYMTYHEPATFVLVPIILTGLLTKKWKGLLRIAGVAALIASLSIMNAVIFDFGQAFRGNPDQPIGWQIFRAQSATSNPLEILGFRSVHTDDPLPYPLAWGLSLLTIGVFGWGVKKSSVRIYTSAMMGFFVLMLLWTALGENGNWYVFNRAVTYTLPVMLVVFAGGLLTLAKRFWRYGMIIVISMMIILTGLKLGWKFVNGHLSVHAWYQTLSEIRDKEISEPIYTTGMMSESVGIWDQIWIGYFLYPEINDGTIPTAKIEDGNLVLLNKSTPWIKYPSYITDDGNWENEYYRLARICLSDDCLSRYPDDLSQIILGMSDHEDSLLVSGWSVPEPDGRWAVGKKSKLKLLTKTSSQTLVIEAMTLKTPQEMRVVIDGREIEGQKIGVAKQSYTYILRSPLGKGVHEIELIFSDTYKPAEVLGNQDQRELAVRFFSIKLE